MSNYSDEDRLKLSEIKKGITGAISIFGVSLKTIFDYVTNDVPLNNDALKLFINQTVDKYGLEYVKLYLDEALKVLEKSQEVSRDVETNTLFQGERGVCVIDDDDVSTAWGHYKKFLEKTGFTNVEDIKESSKNIIQMMSKKTEKNVPVRGAVIGNVQSGKTANMEALLSMAADNGWNFFIILTGLTTNLMDQTRERMLGDLSKFSDDPEDPLVYDWIPINPLTKAKDFNSSYNISFNKKNLYICHAQKNIVHLKNVIQCLNKITQKDKIHLLVIDDEADQASVDSSSAKTINRSKINQLILNLVNNNTHDSTETTQKKNPSSFGSVNYVGYTATPYANLLNEAVGLYPEDFITALTPSSLYMGLRQFYGDGEEEGLNLHATIIDDKIKNIIKRKSNDPLIVPESLKNSIAWFFCCVAILKLRKFGKPVSMLINVDMLVVEHAKMNDAVRGYILNEQSDLVKRCNRVYIEQTRNLTLDIFRETLPDYGEGVENLEIKDYPEYSQIEPIINKLVGNGLTYIKIDRDKKYIYTPDTIHDCVDNGDGNNVPLGEENYDYTSRIIYPNKKEDAEVLAETPAFIVIGGQTLSRGLTIEGLVSTYFIRKTATADTCLQMARWFGFRRGYELLPRIWMDKVTYDAFCGLAIINESLFREIKKYHLDDVNPKDYHARIRDVPAAGMLKSLTSPTKAKGSSKTYKNGGFRAKDKYFTHFYNDKGALEQNIALTEKLISGHKGHRVGEGNSILFEKIPFKEVLEYLDKLVRPAEDSNILSFDSFMEWLKKYDPSSLVDCNVILYSSETESKDLIDPVRKFGEFTINKVFRKKLPSETTDVIHFKTVRDKKSLLMDLDLKKCEELLKDEPGAYQALLKGAPTERCKVHKLLGLNKTATLSITTIGIGEGSEYAADIISPTIFIPGDAESEYDFEKSPYVYLVE